MSNFTITIEIPALERLCACFEEQILRTVVDCIEDEIRKKLTDLPAAVPDPKPEPKPEPKPDPKPEPKPVTLEAVQRAAAQLRDAGKLEAVKALFPEFGIRKLSDLAGDGLQAFAERLRSLGAAL